MFSRLAKSFLRLQSSPRYTGYLSLRPHLEELESRRLLAVAPAAAVAPDSSLSGFVYVDPTNIGVKVPGDPPIAGVVVTLTGTTDSETSVNESTVTDTTGAYSFTGLAEGTYTITETQPNNYIQGKITVGSQGGTSSQTSTTNVISNITIDSEDGTDGTDNDFGNLGLKPGFVSKRFYIDPSDPPVQTNVQSLSGYVFTETSAGSPAFDPSNPPNGEAAEPGATVTLLENGNPVQTTTSGPNGFYAFTGVDPGTYTIQITTPSGTTDDTAIVGTQNTGTAGQGSISSISLSSMGSGTNNDFPLLTTGTVDLSISKVDNAGGSSITPSTGDVIPGQTLIYTIVVNNTGTAAANGATIADTFPSNITADTWTASSTGTNTASGFSITGSGNIDDTDVDMPANSQITYTVTATVSGSATGSLSNTASVAPSGGTAITATDNDNLADLSISKVDDVGGSSITPSTGSVSPGQTMTYTIVVKNTGNGAANGATVVDTFPANITSDTWTATATGGATGFSASGSGKIDDTDVDLPAGSTITYTVTATVSGTASGSLSNTATATPAVGTGVSATDNDTIVLPDLSITKVDNAGGSSITPSTGNVAPGQTLIYTIVVTNSGPGAANGAKITDTFPADVESDTWTASSTGGATGFSATGSSNIDDTDVDMPAGSTITYTVTATVGTATSGSLSNTATATPTVGSPASATDNDTIGVPDLTITKVDNVGGSSITPSTGSVSPGQTMTYTIVVSNTGTGPANGATVVDTFPANITSDTWTATTTGGATGFSATGSGKIDDTDVDLPAGSTITYTVTATVSGTASGSLSNTATVTPAGGTGTSATDNDTIVLPDLSITKVDNAGGSSITPSTGNVAPGQTLIYTIVVSNAGPGAANGAKITDTFPADITADTWTATATGGATGFSATGSSNIDDTDVDMPAGSTITYKVTATVGTATSGSLSNTATATPTIGSPVSAIDNDTIGVPDLSITKVDDAGGSSITPSTGNVSPGQTLHYTIVVSNTGTGPANDASILDTFPADIESDTWTATATGGATGFSATGSNSIDDTDVDMPAGSTITYTVTATVGSATTGMLSNTASVTPSGGTAVTATDNDTIGVPDLSITKIDNAGGSSITNSTGNVIQGQSLQYTIVVSNTGTGPANDASIVDEFPVGFTTASWTATGTGGASGFTTPGTGEIDDTDVNLPAGSTITYVVNGTVSGTASGLTPLSNTATVTPAVGTGASATDTDNLPDLTISKADDVGGSSITPSTGDIAPGQSITYTIVVSNTGLGPINGVLVNDPFPGDLTGVSWTATGTGGASGFTAGPTTGDIDDPSVDLPAGSTVTYTVNATFTGNGGDDDEGPVTSLSNTVTATPPSGPIQTATDNDNVALLNITKIDNSGGSSITGAIGNVAPRQTLTYTIEVTNTGTGTATDAALVDNFPANFEVTSWSAQLLGGATDTTPSGVGNISDSVTVPTTGDIIYTVKGEISPTVTTGTLTNTATVTPANNGTPVSATDTDTIGVPLLSIIKSDDAGGSSETDSVGNVEAGQVLTYTIIVSNNGSGPSPLNTISDDFPPEITSETWMATATGGATGFTPSGSGTIDDSNVILPAGSSITYTVAANVSPTASGMFTNIAKLTPNGSATILANDSDKIVTPDLSISKTDDAGGSSITPSTGNVVPGQTLMYTIKVDNAGPGPADDAAINDNFPLGLTNVSWTAINSGTNPATGFSLSGTGNIADTDVDLPPDSEITYNVTATVGPSATSPLSNTASVTPSGGGAISATDKDNLADLSISKVDNAGGSSITPSTGSVVPGQTLTYTIKVDNTGSGSVTGAAVVDNFPTGILSETWTASSTGTNMATGFTASGSGNIDDTVDLPGDSEITYTVTALVSGTATGSLSNTATVTPTAGNGASATDNDDLTDLSITKSDNAGGSSVTPSTGGVSQGQSLTYTIVAGNGGPGTITGASVTDDFPADFTVTSWTAVVAGGASDLTSSGTGNIADTVTIPTGGTVTYTVTGTVSPTASGTLSNTATMTPTVGNSVSATDNDTVLIPELSISKGDNVGGSSITPTTGTLNQGQSFKYTIVVDNTGNGAAIGAVIADLFPADITADSWNAVNSGANPATGFSATGTGNIDDADVDMPAHSEITYTVNATVSGTATGTLSNTATVTSSNGGTISATDKDNLLGLTISKADDAGGSSITPSTGNVTPGQSLAYTIIVGNTAAATATGASVTDDFPTDFTVTSWTAAVAGGASDTTPSGAGNIGDTVTIPQNGTVTYTVTGTVSNSATGTLSNMATVTPAGGGGITATDDDTIGVIGTPNLTIDETDNAGGAQPAQVVAPGLSVANANGQNVSSDVTPVGNVIPGQTFKYTIVVSNNGTGPAIGATIADTFDASEFTSDSWTATATGGATGFSVSGNGNIDDIVDMPAGSQITYTVTVTVSNTASGSLSNTPSVTPAGGGAVTATDNDNLADLSITKVDSAGGSSITPSTGLIFEPATIAYTIVVDNSGLGAANNLAITDLFPADFTVTSWTAASTGGATGFSPSGTGDIDDTNVDMPGSSQITYTVNGTVGDVTTLSNTASVQSVGGTLSATDNDTVEASSGVAPVGGLQAIDVAMVDGTGGSSSTGAPAASPTTGNVGIVSTGASASVAGGAGLNSAAIDSLLSGASSGSSSTTVSSADLTALSDSALEDLDASLSGPGGWAA